MSIGTLLILLGVIFAVLDVFIDTSGRVGRATLLHLAVILIGIGVLIGGGPLTDDAAAAAFTAIT